MKVIPYFLLACSLFCATGCSAADHDFDSVVSSVEHRYSVHPQRIPLMGLISFCARMYTHDGVKGMHIAEFDDLHGVNVVELSSLMESQLGKDWQPFLTEREQGSGEGEQTVIFARPAGHFMRMLIVDYDHGELDLVRMEVNGASLSKWIKDQEHRDRSSQHNYATGD